MRNFILPLLVSIMVSGTSMADSDDDGKACLENCYAKHPCLRLNEIRPNEVCTPEQYQEEEDACQEECSKDSYTIATDLMTGNRSKYHNL